MHTFLALGDSYTIGEAVAEDKTWPVQLVQQLRKEGVKIADPEIIATTGWTTGELQEGIFKRDPANSYSLVSLQIGVNNQYRGNPLSIYQQEFEELLQQAITFAGGINERVVVLSIPDYGVTPFSRDKNPAKIAEALALFNDVNREITQRNGAFWVDITPLSRQAGQDPSLTAEDGLHPSAKMYALWADEIMPYVVNLLRND